MRQGEAGRGRDGEKGSEGEKGRGRRGVKHAPPAPLMSERIGFESVAVRVVERVPKPEPRVPPDLTEGGVAAAACREARLVREGSGDA